ncbi:MAG: hypothetical protein Q9191_003553 [Dirinaria sp. TL-2023a]
MDVHKHSLGHWLPKDLQAVQQWLGNSIDHIDNLPDKHLKRELQDFEKLVEDDITLKILASLMFTEVPEKPPYNHDPEFDPQVRDFRHMLRLLDHIMDSAPKWSQIANKVGLIGFPISAIIEWPMCTSSGNAFFLRPDVNEQWAKILRRWAVYMGSPDSTNVLTDRDDGWLSSVALNELSIIGNNGVTSYTFDQLYVCDKSAPHYGYKSWDDFFIREFQADKRPLQTAIDDNFLNQLNQQRPDFPSFIPPINLDSSALIYNACESTPVFLRRHNDVHTHAEFWFKNQPYSLSRMLDNDSFTPQFEHGTVYQAFLSALSYHRWHSPVDGTIVRAFNVPGTYYSANYFEGFANPKDQGGPDPLAPTNSQAYITSVAARAVILIQADNPDIGLMGFVAFGMCEVSSNEITVREGQHIKAGEQLGMFHFGGSTHCLLFRKGVEVAFVQEPQGKGGMYNPSPEHNTPLRSAIGAVVKTT